MAAEGLRRLGVQAILTDGAFETNFNGKTTSHTEAVTVGGKVFISSHATLDPINIYQHEVIHVMKNVEPTLYDTLYDMFSYSWDTKSAESQRLIGKIGEVYFGIPVYDDSTGVQVSGFDDGDWRHIKGVYDELIAYINGYNASDPTYAREEFGGAFTDYDAFLRVLDEIWEQFSASRQSNRADVQTNQEEISFEAVRNPSQEQGIEIRVEEMIPPGAKKPIRVYTDGYAIVNAGKVESYIRGKVEVDLAAEEAKQEKLIRIMENTPEAFTDHMEEDLQASIDKVHNYIRSKEMNTTLETAGILDDERNTLVIAGNLMDAAKQVKKGNTKIYSYIEGPNDRVEIESWWKIMKDGTPYLATLILRPVKE